MQSKDEIIIPPLMHFIWAGGTKLLPEEGMRNIAKWHLTNDKFQPILWVDPKTSRIPLDQLMIQYQEAFKRAYIEEYKAKNSGNMPDDMEIPNLEIKDIREPGICAAKDDIVDYAIDRIDPNYGISSDILRYRILFKYGGGYVDVTDVTPSQKINDSIFKTGNVDSPTHAVFLDHLSQRRQITQLQLSQFNLPQINSRNTPLHDLESHLKDNAVGNDTFFCTRGNPLMRHLSERAENNFLFVRNSANVSALMMSYTGYNTKDMTIEKTGPTLVTRELLDLMSGRLESHARLSFAYVKTIKDQRILIRPVRCSEYTLTQPIKNTRMWNNVTFDMQTIPSIELVYQKIINIIRFEASEMNILRLDDHLRMLGKIAKLFKLDPKEVQSVLIDQILKAQPPIALQDVMFPQSVSLNSMAIDFYRKNKLYEKIYLFKQPISDDQEKFGGQLERFDAIFHSVTSYGYFSTIMFNDTQLSQTKTHIIQQHFSQIEIANMFDMIDRGSEFIQKLFSEIDKYPIYKYLFENVPDYIKMKDDLPIKYAKILHTYQDAFLLSGVSHYELLEANKRVFGLCGKSMLIERLNEISARYTNCGQDYEKVLRNAVVNNRIDDVRFLVNWVDINATSQSTKQSALHLAAQKGNAEIVKILIENGASTSLIDSNNKTPADLAPLEMKLLFESVQERVLHH